MPSIEENGSFDELLGDPVSVEEKDAVTSLQDGGVEPETAERARIRELEAQIAAANDKAASASKSAALKDAENRLAVASTRAFEAGVATFEEIEEDDPNTIVFHIVASGFTFASHVWWVGQTVKIKKDGQSYQDTLDRNGNSWLDDITPAAQYKRWGKIVIAAGPYTGPAFNDAVSKLDAFRKGAAPVVNL